MCLIPGPRLLSKTLLLLKSIVATDPFKAVTEVAEDLASSQGWAFLRLECCVGECFTLISKLIIWTSIHLFIICVNWIQLIYRIILVFRFSNLHLFNLTLTYIITHVSVEFNLSIISIIFLKQFNLNGHVWCRYFTLWNLYSYFFFMYITSRDLDALVIFYYLWLTSPYLNSCIICYFLNWFYL